MKFVLIFTIYTISLSLFSQNEKQKTHIKLSQLTDLYKSTINAQSDSIKLYANSIFYDSLYYFISKNNITNQLDSFFIISKIKSSDNKIQIFTYNLQLSSGDYINYGIIKLIKKNITIRLTDKSASITDPVNKIFDQNNWLGAVYYNIITHHYGKNKVYILLGLNANNLTTNYKIIEPLQIINNKPIFGMSLFKFPENKHIIQKRVIFEYSDICQFNLFYNKKKDIIIFDHINSPDSSLINIPQFSGPDLSFDAFVRKKNQWIYTPDIDARNKKSQLNNTKIIPHPRNLFKQKNFNPR